MPKNSPYDLNHIAAMRRKATQSQYEHRECQSCARLTLDNDELLAIVAWFSGINAHQDPTMFNSPVVCSGTGKACKLEPEEDGFLCGCIACYFWRKAVEVTKKYSQKNN